MPQTPWDALKYQELAGHDTSSLSDSSALPERSGWAPRRFGLGPTAVPPDNDFRGASLDPVPRCENQRSRTRRRGDLAIAADPEWPILAPSFRESVLWYVPIMPSISPSASGRGVVTPSAPSHAQTTRPPPLSAIHARALYRPVAPVEVDDDGFPYSDGSLVESQNHEKARAHLVAVVRARFADRTDVYAASELGFYFEQGNRRALVVPDAFVAFGVDEHPQLSYKLWEQSKVPDFVLEVVSRRTWRKDVYDKPGLYAALGIAEYWLFDPYRVRRDGGAVLEGRRLGDRGTWEPVPAAAGGGLVSEALDLDILVDAGDLRLRDRATGEIVPDLAESMALTRRAAARADREAERADREAKRAEAAEKRLAELAARLAGSAHGHEQPDADNDPRS